MVWQQHKHKFQHPNLIICEEYDLFTRSLFVQLFFIDKKRLEKLIETYKTDFKEVLGETFCSKKLLAAIEKKRKLRPLIKNDEKLLGLILGFGREASETFRDYDYQTATENEPSKIVGYRPSGCLITPVSFRANPNSAEVQNLLAA